MPFLRLRELRSGEAREFDAPAVRIGRDPESEFPVSGESAKVVSSAHARLVHDGAKWWVEDLGSRNGTYLDGRRLVPGRREALEVGSVIGLGETGPRLKVEAASRQHLEETVVEAPPLARPSAPTIRLSELDALAAAAPSTPARPADRAPAPSPPPSPAPPPAPSPPPTTPAAQPRPPGSLRVVFREARTGEVFVGVGGRLRIGRGAECEVRPVAAGDTTVSRVHAEVVLKPDGTVVVRDARSRNGTFVNGEALVAERVLGPGDRILLGEGGPELVVEQLSVPLARTDAAPKVERPAAAAPAPPAAAPRRSFGGKGATVFFREMIEETDRRAKGRLRWVVWSFVGLLVAATAGLYVWSEARVRRTAAALEEQQRVAMAAAQRTADSLRRAAQDEYERLRMALDSARGSSAPAAVVESLRAALDQASHRTAALEASLERAQAALNQQIAAGDSLRRQAQAELARLRNELNRAGSEQASGALFDSLRRALKAAEERANSIDQQLRAVRGVDLAAISQAHQAAVGLVTTFAGSSAWDGSGFVITRSGYFITNRHVVQPEGRPADSVFVTMADHQYADRVVVVAVAPAGAPDLAVLKIPNYSGPYVTSIDWAGTRARQGEPAALIGFPQGAALALDQTRTVRTSMSAGIFSKVTPERIQFDGFTIGGSSGSPIFNASGEVVAIHAAGLKEAAGLGFAVPIRMVLPLLPPDAKAELGIS
jgi:pSer/pThr/pTyr-binding forkhead associated (FHA) protein/S1-C subfamily serine protease